MKAPQPFTTLGLRSLIAVAVGFATVANAAPLQRRLPIPADQINGFPQLVPPGITGQVYLAFQPLLDVSNGCVPFPAVDGNGNTNAGVNVFGAMNSGCFFDAGQAYVRSAQYGGYTALMYAWYFPKDQPLDNLNYGHIHEWEGAIVWIRDPASTAPQNVVAVCPSQFGYWVCSTVGRFALSGSRPLLDYEASYPYEHAMYTTSTIGGTQPLVAWESLPIAAQNALQITDFGQFAVVPFKDSTFTRNLASARFS